MVGVDEAHGDTKATITTARAQQILQQYQAYKASGGQTAPAKVPSAPPQSFQSSSPQINISQAQLQKTNALRAEQDLPPLQEVSNVKVIEPTHTTAPQQSVPRPDLIRSQPSIPSAPSTNPQLRSAVLTSLAQNPKALGSIGSGEGSYLNALYQKGVLAAGDFSYVNALIGNYNVNVQKQNAQARQANIQAAKNQEANIKSQLQSVQQSGATQVQILNAKGDVIGTVNPQNLGQANLQTLKLVNRSGGVALRYPGQSRTETTSTLTTPTFREDPLSLFARPVLAMGAEIGGQLVQTFTTGKFAPTGLQALQGQGLTTPEVAAQTEKAYGVSQEVSNLMTGQYKGGQQAAALAGIIASVAIPTTAGMSGIGKIPELATLSARFSGKTAAQTTPKIVKAFQERGLIPQQTENVGLTKSFTQGTEQQVNLKESPYQTKPLIKPMDIGGGKTVNVRAGQGKFPYPLTENVLAVGAKGEKVVKTVPKTLTVKEEETGQATLQDLFTSEHQVATVRAGKTVLEKSQIMIENPSPELKTTLGLELVQGTKNVYAGKATQGVMDYLKAAQKAGLVSEQLGEIHVQSREDLIKNPQAYMELSRNPEEFQTEKIKPENISAESKPFRNLKTNTSKFKESDLVRPQATGFYRSTPLKVQTFPKGDITPKPYKAPSSPFPGSKGSKETIKGIEPDLSNFHNIGASKQEVLLKEKPLQRQEPLQTVKSIKETFSVGSTMFRTTKTSLVKPATANVNVRPTSSQKLKSVPSTIEDVIQTPDITQQIKGGFSSQTEKLGRLTNVKPVIITTQKTEQTPITTTIQRQGQLTTQGLQQKQLQGFQNPIDNITKPIDTITTRKPPFGLLFGTQSGGLGKVSKGGARKGFIGNVPLTSIVGVYKRSEITYGNVKAPKSSAPRPTKLSSKGNKFRL